MQFDAILPPTPLTPVPELARAAEQVGFDALWSTETQHDPFLPLALAAEHTRRLELGTAVAVGFARSPATLAYTAWDLAEASRGRFILGLGTQVRAHIVRRFGMPWPESPAGQMRDLIGGVRALWTCWQTGERLDYRGAHFKLSLMTPFFNPGPIDHPEIPIYLAGVNRAMARLAGELADGFLVHPYHSAEYLREVIRPGLAEGAARAGRSASAVRVAVTAMVVTAPEEADLVRAQIAFYASTPNYRPVMEHHGWGEVADRLSLQSRRGEWGEMAAQIDDRMLATFAVVSSEAELVGALWARYHDLADRLALYTPFSPGMRDAWWTRLAQDLRRPG